MGEIKSHPPLLIKRDYYLRAYQRIDKLSTFDIMIESGCQRNIYNVE